MSLTDMVLMPGTDYQKICDHIREVYNVDYPIVSGIAEGMVGSFKDILRERSMDWLLSGDSCAFYENDRITNIASYAFYYAAGPKKARFPNVKSVQMGAFRSNAGVEEVYFPNATSASNNIFQSATNLKEVDFGGIHNIMGTVFNGAASLTKLVLRKADRPVSLASTSAFAGTPYAASGSGGKIYVLEALIEEYKTATNWSVLYGYGKCEFVPIEGSEYE